MAESFDLGALVEEFRDEAREQIDGLDAGLLALEREGGLEDDRRSALLRTLHTLKGNAGMLGLGPVRDFVHAMENVLKSQEEWSREVVDGLFDGAAALRSAVEAVGSEREGAAFGELTAARHRLEGLESSGEAVVRGGGGDGDTEVVSGVVDRVRVPFAKLDGLLADVGELAGAALGLERRLAERGARELRDDAESIRRRADALREGVMSLRLVPIGRVLSRFHGLVRRLAAEQGKEARLVVVGEGTELDKSTADALAEPLLHLVRNAIDHGIGLPEEREAAGRPRHGTVWIRASQEGDRVRLEVADDGEGLDVEAVRDRAEEAGLVEPGVRISAAEAARLIFRPGFSTRSDVSTVSGRGVGLDVVRRSVRELRGELDLEFGSASNGETRFVLRLPLTVAVVPSVVFEAAGELMALPAGDVVRTVRLGDLDRIGAAPVLREEERVVPVVDADRLFGWPPADRGPFGVVVSAGGGRVILSADRLHDQRDLVVKALPGFGGPTRAVSGGSVLPGGRVILMLDPTGIIDLSEERAGGDGGG